MANQMPNGRWRGRVVDPRTHKQVAPHTIIGGPKSFVDKRKAERAEDEARDALLGIAERGITVREFWEDWTTSSLWARPAESTNVHLKERTQAFVEVYGERPITTIDAAVTAEWLKGGQNIGTVPSLCTFFNDARRPQAGMLVTHNPFAGIGLKKSKGRKTLQPPDQVAIANMLEQADELTPPSFHAWLLTAVWSAARPGELDALMREDLDFQAEEIRIERQWNVKVRKFTPPKHGSMRTIAMTEPVKQALLALPRSGQTARVEGEEIPTREGEFLFETVRGHHYTPSTRNHHWNRVRASSGMGNTALYLATRHFYGWYALNVLDLPPHVIALHLGHTDGGRLVRELYGHPDAAIARKRMREAFRDVAQVTPFPKVA